MSEPALGERLPHILTPPPGPRSRELAGTLRRVECPNITFISPDFPIFWEEAIGSNVRDVDGNVYLDLTGAFGVAAAGHRSPRVVQALHDQLDKLVHGMGDVHPPEIKVRTLERLAEIAPGDLRVSILASSGSEAVEAALKTARLASGAPAVLCFGGAYHGLTYGALALTDGDRFRAPFLDQIGLPSRRIEFPDPRAPAGRGPDPEERIARSLEAATRAVRESPERVGGVILEPIQARAGVIVPPDGFLGALRDWCDRHELLLILDEIYTGFGRTGAWFACQHEGVVPDLLCVGKALTGGLPFSACIGPPAVMSAWPPSEGEAIHTSTFLGHPLGCAAALAQIDEIADRKLVDRAARLGRRALERTASWTERFGFVADVRGRGLLLGVEIVRAADRHEPDAERTRRIVRSALRDGLLLLPAAAHGNVIMLSPPLTITERQLEFALERLEDCLARS